MALLRLNGSYAKLHQGAVHILIIFTAYTDDQIIHLHMQLKDTVSTQINA
jgi:hypothetical protein